jgi:hypothetical protein
MKKFGWKSILAISVVASAFLMFGMFGIGHATIIFQDGFETSWAGDYAPGWVNAAYRHGPAPVGQMMQQTTQAHNGSYGMQLIASSVPEAWMWWAAVEVTTLPSSALEKRDNPYVSAWYYDEGTVGRAGQIYAVPDWVNPYIPPGEDWTDVQFGARFNVTDKYYYVAAGENSPGWQSTAIDRSDGWHNLMFQLSATDGRIHFYLDGAEVGQSYRNDYTNLGTAIGLYTMFQDPLSNWGSDKPYTLWDDFQVGSTNVPEPGILLLLGTGLIGLAAFGRRVKKGAR